MRDEGVPQQADGQLPVRLRFVEVIGKRKAGAQALVDARVRGEQGELVCIAGAVGGPPDLAARCLQRQHEVERACHRRPQLAHEAVVASDTPVMPHTDGDVRRVVGLRHRLLHAPVLVRRCPVPVTVLRAREPSVRCRRFGVEAAHVERHGSFDVVPRVGMATREPRDQPGWFLRFGNRGGGRDEVSMRQHARQLKRRHERPLAYADKARDSFRSAG